MKKVATWLNLLFASIVVVGVFLQAYFIASYMMGAGQSALDAHGFLGFAVIHGSEVLVFVTAIAAFWRNWRRIAVDFGFPVLGTIQIFLLPPDENPSSAWLHGLHGLLALFVLVYAAYIVRRDLRLLGLIRHTGADETPKAAAVPEHNA